MLGIELQRQLYLFLCPVHGSGGLSKSYRSRNREYQEGEGEGTVRFFLSWYKRNARGGMRIGIERVCRSSFYTTNRINAL